MSTKNDIFSGNVFGKWIVIGKAQSKHNKARWLCKCECGAKKEVYASYLRKGSSTSCGCFRKEQVKIAKTLHGHAKKNERNKTYRSWESMLRRVTSNKYKGYLHYGGRGISVDPRWLSYENFLIDMGNRPENTTLDRINVDKDYGPQNCRWADTITQRHNRRDSKIK